MLYSAWRPNQVSFSGVPTAASNSAAVMASLSRVASVSALHYGWNFQFRVNKIRCLIPFQTRRKLLKMTLIVNCYGLKCLKLVLVQSALCLNFHWLKRQKGPIFFGRNLEIPSIVTSSRWSWRHLWPKLSSLNQKFGCTFAFQICENLIITLVLKAISNQKFTFSDVVS